MLKFKLKIHTYLLPVILISQITFSQDSIQKQDTIQKIIPKHSTIEFIDGRILKGKLFSFDLYGSNGDDKIKLCQEDNEKDCKKYPIKEINKITLLPSEGYINRSNKANDEPIDKSELIRYFKVLFSPIDNRPYLAQLVYGGENFEFYSFYATNSISKTKKFKYSQYFIVKAEKSIILKKFSKTSDKKNLDKLTEIFKGCSAFNNEAKQKKAYKKHSLYYFFQLADKCSL